MADDVTIETVYRVRSNRTGGVTLHSTMEEAQGAVRDAVFMSELSRLMGDRVDLGVVRMLLAQADRVIVLLAQYRGGEDRPQRTGLAVEADKDTGGIALAIMPTRRPMVSGQGDLLQGTADEAAGLTRIETVCLGCGRKDGTHDPICVNAVAEQVNAAGLNTDKA